MKDEKFKFPSALELASALGEHVRQMRPSVTPMPKKKQISAARVTATDVNALMNMVKTSVQVSKLTDSKPTFDFMNLE